MVIIADFHSAAVRFGKPGKLYIAPLGTAEPTTVSDAWPTGWVALGYTETGSTFNYNIETASVSVAEVLDVFAYTTTGRTASVVTALAEVTKRNLNLVFNNGVISGSGVGDSSNWVFEPPALGAEVRVMLGWDANATAANNDLRFLFRQVIQSGQLSIANQKGAAIAGLATTFNLEVPATGLAVLKIYGAGALNPA